MNPNSVGSDEWEDCPKGTLLALANRSQQQRALKRAAWAIPLTLVMLLAFGGWLSLQIRSDTTTLSCDHVVKLLPTYASNTLSVTQRAQVERHLKTCLPCAEKLRTIQATPSMAKSSGGRIRLHPVANRKLRSVALNREDPKSLRGFMHFDQPTRPVAKYQTKSPSVSVH